MSAKQQRSKTVRRSVALSRELLEDVKAHASPELRSNVNRLVTIALQEFVANRKRRKFEEAMAKMATDPQLCQESQQISTEFLSADFDGLANLDWQNQ